MAMETAQDFLFLVGRLKKIYSKRVYGLALADGQERAQFTMFHTFYLIFVTFYLLLPILTFAPPHPDLLKILNNKLIHSPKINLKVHFGLDVPTSSLFLEQMSFPQFFFKMKKYLTVVQMFSFIIFYPLPPPLPNLLNSRNKTKQTKLN